MTQAFLMRWQVTALWMLFIPWIAAAQTDATTEPSLVAAAADGNEALLNSLLRAGATVDQPNSKGVTALIAATRGGDRNLGLVKSLIDAGADRRLRDQIGRNAFQIAVTNGHLELTRYYLESGSSVTDDWPVPGAGRSEPLAALAGASPNPEVARLLLEHGVNFRVYGAGGLNCGPFYWALKLDRDKTLRFLQSRKKEQFWECQKGISPLMLAIELGKRSEIIEFLAEPDEVNRAAQTGEIALGPATALGNLVAVDILLKRGANARQETGGGTTALHLAAAMGHKAIAEKLLAAGASLEARNKRRETPLHHAVLGCRAAMADSLVEWGGDTLARDLEGNGLMGMAVLSRCVTMLEWALARKQEIDDSNSMGRTPLMLAAMVGTVDVVRWLASKGAKLDMRDYDGQSALSIAIGHNRAEAVKFLLELGAK
jgi:ankyrin repeat protein